MRLSRHKHKPAKTYTTNLGFEKDVCDCGAYRCQELLGDLWVKSAPHAPHLPLAQNG